ncbi:MAG: HesA/MoeB/ThiF family protein [Porphyromonadaceae bacterium]|nr:HesA/MoeB/ThiF family protein [Porphyromonadaceae bacterium]
MEYTERYARQIMLPEVGLAGQKRLSQGSALLVGAGGLGSPIALYLCSAGIGRLGIIDGDRVSENNLQRQILYTEEEVGLPKVDCAKRSLAKHNSACTIETYPCFLTEENGEEIIGKYDIVVDGCDNYATRYLIDEECYRLHKPYVYGSINGFCGQVSVFDGEKGKRYARLYPDRSYLLSRPKEPIGLIAPIAAVIGSIEAAEVIKLLTGCGEPLYNKLFTLDLKTMESVTLDL